jgi:excisionase family DNA binding protein
LTYNARMQIGDQTVYSLSEAAALLGLDRRTLYLQVKRGQLRATMSGREYRVLSSEVERYREEVQGKHGFAAPSHPLYGTRGGGGRRRKEQRDSERVDG